MIDLKSNSSTLSGQSFYVLVILSLVFGILTLLNILQSDYFGDDLYNFQIPGLIQLEDRSMFDYIAETTKGWIDSNGRVFPLGFYGYYIFDIFNGNIFGYKLFILSFIVLNIALFSYLVYSISNSKFLALGILLITPLLFQYRYYHDSILAFHGLMQLLFLLTTASLLGFVKYIQSKRLIHYYTSLIFFVLSLLTYEISYLFFLLYIPLALTYLDLKSDFRKVVKVLMPYLLITFLAIVSTLYLRGVASLESGPYLFSWNFYAIVKTYFYQTFSVLPITYFTHFASLPGIHHINIFTLFSGSVVFLYVYLKLMRTQKTEIDGLKMLVFLAVLIITLPGVLIAFSTKFQGFLGAMNMVKFGLPYIPIYIQTFGMSLLIVVLLHKFLEDSNKRKLRILVVMLLVYLVHHIGNNQVIEKVNAPYKDGREVLTELLSGKFGDQLKEGDVVSIMGESPIHSKNFISMITGKNIGDLEKSEEGSTSYKVQYEAGNDNAIIDIYNDKIKKNFIVAYGKKDGKWVEVYNEFSTKNLLADDYFLPPIFTNFYPWEGKVGRFRWASKNPSFLWVNPSNNKQTERIFFYISALDARQVEISLNGDVVETVDLKPGEKQLVDKKVELIPGRNSIQFITHKDPVDPPGADDRMLTFSLERVHPFFVQDE